MSSSDISVKESQAFSMGLGPVTGIGDDDFTPEMILIIVSMTKDLNNLDRTI